jgi:hypothetical protein
MHVDRALSKRIAQRSKAEYEQCYHAACYALLDCSELSIGRYVEGYTVDEAGLILGHGWIELGDKIVDPTAYERTLTYFPGLRFSRSQAWEAMATVPKPEYVREDLPIFYRFGWGGCDSPEMMQAWASARAFSASQRQHNGRTTHLDSGVGSSRQGANS